MSTNMAENQQINPIIGASIPRIEGPEKATGRAVYTDDITRPGMLHAAPARQSLPSCKDPVH